MIPPPLIIFVVKIAKRGEIMHLVIQNLTNDEMSSAHDVVIEQISQLSFNLV